MGYGKVWTWSGIREGVRRGGNSLPTQDTPPLHKHGDQAHVNLRRALPFTLVPRTHLATRHTSSSVIPVGMPAGTAPTAAAAACIMPPPPPCGAAQVRAKTRQAWMADLTALESWLSSCLHSMTCVKCGHLSEYVREYVCGGALDSWLRSCLHSMICGSRDV